MISKSVFHLQVLYGNAKSCYLNPPYSYTGSTSSADTVLKSVFPLRLNLMAPEGDEVAFSLTSAHAAFTSQCLKGKKESRVSSRMAENTRSYKKKIGVGGWGGRAVIGSSHRCDVCGREMKSSSRIAVVIFFFVIASVRMCAKRLVRGACRSAHTAVCL